MKKIIFTIPVIALLLFSFKGPVIVPRAVKETMHLQFRDISEINWEKSEFGPYVAEFMQNGKEFNVWFMPNGELKRIDVEIGWVELPVAARKQIIDDYSKCRIVKMMQNQDENSEAPYIVELMRKNKDRKLYFNKAGELVFERDKE
jgi:hypothetical protein